MSELNGRLVAVDQLTDSQRAAMFELMEQCYEGVRPDDFERDLREKQWVVLIEQADPPRVRGFSTQVVLESTVGGQPIQALFSGDTVIAPDAWGAPALPRVWGRLALSLIDQRPDATWYWFLISKGYKTYRFLPVFFHEFYPRREHATPGWASDAIAALASQKFGSRFDPVGGVLRADDHSARLRAGIAPVTDQRWNDPDVRFFVQCNPGHGRGDELCCLAPLSRANFKPAARRVIGLEAFSPAALHVSPPAPLLGTWAR
ncbi:MAG: hypothetical protein J5I93_06145 [Pirellulaceae bacterium]|nr:hypothetical protein [Pirellulaceae bacterium]